MAKLSIKSWIGFLPFCGANRGFLSTSDDLFKFELIYLLRFLFLLKRNRLLVYSNLQGGPGMLFRDPR